MPTPERIIEVLNRLREYISRALADGALVLLDNNADGRLNSQENERQISDALRLYAHSSEWFRDNELAIEVAEPRFWYDFCVRGPHSLFVPVNVKVSTFQTADNVSSKMGLFYALTGVDPSSVRLNSWEHFCQNLAEHLGRDQSADYYFIAVNKTDPGDVIWTGLKLLQSLRPNGSNPPYQCKWADNRVRVERTFDEAANFILSVVRESFYRGANSLVSFDRHLARFAR
jgi:hypothetical protein